MFELFQLMLGVVAVCGGAYVLGRDSRSRRDQREAEDRATPAISAISDARDGQLVRVVGRVISTTGFLEAPVSGRPCVAYEMSIGDGEWRRNEHRSCEFLIEDGAGKALVQGVGAKLHLSPNYEEKVIADSPSPRMAAVLDSYKVRSKGRMPWGAQVLLCEEATVSRGDSVVIVGRARWELDSDPATASDGYRDIRRRLVLHGTRACPLVLESPQPPQQSS